MRSMSTSELIFPRPDVKIQLSRMPLPSESRTQTRVCESAKWKARRALSEIVWGHLWEQFIVGRNINLLLHKQESKLERVERVRKGARDSTLTKKSRSMSSRAWPAHKRIMLVDMATVLYPCARYVSTYCGDSAPPGWNTPTLLAQSISIIKLNQPIQSKYSRQIPSVKAGFLLCSGIVVTRVLVKSA